MYDSNYSEIKWKDGSRFKLAPGKAHAVIERVRKRGNGNITPDAVVEEAKKPRSHLHPEFEWDDEIAAHEHRMERARTLIRSIMVVRAEAPEVTARAYEVRLAAPDPDKPGTQPSKVYQTTEDILADPIARDRLLGRALSELAGFRQRYAGISELAVVFNAINDVSNAA